MTVWATTGWAMPGWIRLGPIRLLRLARRARRSMRSRVLAPPAASQLALTTHRTRRMRWWLRWTHRLPARPSAGRWTVAPSSAGLTRPRWGRTCCAGSQPGWGIRGARASPGAARRCRRAGCATRSGPVTGPPPWRPTGSYRRPRRSPARAVPASSADSPPRSGSSRVHDVRPVSAGFLAPPANPPECRHRQRHGPRAAAPSRRPVPLRRGGRRVAHHRPPAAARTRCAVPWRGDRRAVRRAAPIGATAWTGRRRGRDRALDPRRPRCRRLTQRHVGRRGIRLRPGQVRAAERAVGRDQMFQRSKECRRLPGLEAGLECTRLEHDRLLGDDALDRRKTGPVRRSR